MEPSERFVEAVNRVPAAVPLDVAALCIAARAHPGLDVDAGLAQIDALAARCPDATFEGLREHLFEREGFAGNLDHYADPENSFLDSVLERRLGIPISLSVLMIVTGRRLGVDAQGVGMPGHFLVLDVARGDVWCDPFHGGALLDVDGCRRQFELVYGGALVFQPAFLAPTPAPAIVARMLANLERSDLATDPVQRAGGCASCTSRSRASRSRSRSSSPTSSRARATSCVPPGVRGARRSGRARAGRAQRERHDTGAPPDAGPRHSRARMN